MRAIALCVIIIVLWAIDEYLAQTPQSNEIDRPDLRIEKREQAICGCVSCTKPKL